jgi:uncharacterized protein
MLQNLAIPAVRAALIYVALLALGAVLLSLLVVRQRRTTKTGLGDGGNPLLSRFIRVHGNYAENVPFGLAVITLLAFTDDRAWPVHVVGSSLVIGRVAHAIGVGQSSGLSAGRVTGMFLTWLALLFGASLLLLRLF